MLGSFLVGVLMASADSAALVVLRLGGIATEVLELPCLVGKPLLRFRLERADWSAATASTGWRCMQRWSLTLAFPEKPFCGAALAARSSLP